MNGHDDLNRYPIGVSAWLGARRAMPLALSSGMLGVLYGAACISLGISPALAALSCVLVFSGAIQFAVLGMLDEPASFAAIAVSSLLICNRLALMGASMADHLRARSWTARLLAMTVLTDGAWAATMAVKEPVDKFWFFLGAGVWILLLWVSGTLLGTVIAGSLDPELVAALRFAGILFLALLLLLVVRNTSATHTDWLVSAVVSMAASQFVPLFVAFVLGVTTGGMLVWHRVTRTAVHVDE